MVSGVYLGDRIYAAVRFGSDFLVSSFTAGAVVMPVINRDYENDKEDSCVTVILDCGFKVDFWLTGLSDEEYVWRAYEIKELEFAEAQRGREQ